jgi:hypothetical protein
VGDRDDLLDRRDRAERVRGPRKRNDARPLVRQRAQVVEVETPLVVEVAEVDGDALVVGELEPRRDVRVVVELRRDDLVARPPLARDRT